MSRPEVSGDEWKVLESGTPEEEEAAFHTIVLHYQYLVEGTARKLQRKLPSYLEDDELISFGQMGLLKAVRRYKPEQGPFSKYASTVVYGAIIDGLRAADFAPRGLRRQQRDLENVIQELQNDGILTPSVAQIALVMEATEEDVLNLQQKIQRADVSPHDPTRLGSVQGQESLLSRELCREFVNYLRKQEVLTQKVIALRYWAGYNIKQISQALKISPEQVRVRHLEVLSAILPLVAEVARDD